jgi:hypothetical protein
MFKISGTVRVVNNTVQVSEKFSKREFVITDNSGPYEQHISFQATQDKCALLDTVSMGDQVEVSFNLRGREWTSPQGEIKYFNTLEAWRIEKVGQAQGMPQGGPTAMSLDPLPSSVAPSLSSDEEDDLPF